MTEGENMDRETQYGQKYTNMDRQSKIWIETIWIEIHKYGQIDTNMDKQTKI